MSGRTLIVEFHAWRGIAFAGGPILTWIHLGFVSVSWVPFLFSEWLRTKLDGMKNALRPGKSQATDAFGDYPKVPHELVKRP